MSVLNGVPVDLTVVLGSADLPIRQILKLNRGSMIPLNCSHDPRPVLAHFGGVHRSFVPFQCIERLVAAPGLQEQRGNAYPAQAAEGGGEGGPSPFIALEPITMSIIEYGTLTGALQVTLSLQAKSPEIAEKLNARLPEQRTKAIAAVNEYVRLHVSAYRPVDAAALREALRQALLPTTPGLADVLITDVVARP